MKRNVWSKISPRGGQPVMGVDPAATASQEIELAEEAVDKPKGAVAIPRKAGQHSESPPVRSRIFRWITSFRNLKRDSLDNICPWDNECLSVFTSPINIPQRRKVYHFDDSFGEWSNHAVPANSSLIDMPMRRAGNVVGYQNPAYEPMRNMNPVQRGEGFGMSPGGRQQLRRADRSYNFAVDYPEAFYESGQRYGRGLRYNDEEIVEQLNSYVEGQDEDLMFRISL